MLWKSEKKSDCHQKYNYHSYEAYDIDTDRWAEEDTFVYAAIGEVGSEIHVSFDIII